MLQCCTYIINYQHICQFPTPIHIYTSKYLWNIYDIWNVHYIFVKYVFLSQTCSRNSVPPGQVGPRGPHGSLPGWVCPVAPQEGWHIDSDRFKLKKWTFLKCVWVCLGCLMHALHMFWIVVVLIIRLFIMYVYMCLWSMSFTATWQSDMFGKCFLPYPTIIIPNHFQQQKSSISSNSSVLPIVSCFSRFPRVPWERTRLEASRGAAKVTALVHQIRLPNRSSRVTIVQQICDV